VSEPAATGPQAPDSSFGLGIFDDAPKRPARDSAAPSAPLPKKREEEDKAEPARPEPDLGFGAGI
jgi:hypothetical protein